MPLVEYSTYTAPFGFSNGHVQTIYPTLFRRVSPVTTERARIETPDGDFLDLDWKRGTGTGRVVVLSHGLEGDSSNDYVQGMAGAFHRAGWDVLAWNFRGCSGEANRLLRFYHSGATEDLEAVIRHVLASGHYTRVALVGFSLGGNMTLKYLGEAGENIDPRIVGAVTYSVPCDLAAASRQLEKWVNRIYMRRFLGRLRMKIRDKMEMFPGELEDAGMDRMRTFREFDGAYTAPLHGFESAEDYWLRASSKPVLPAITVPTLLVNARNDPFLGPKCYPFAAAEENPDLYFEAPEDGGHVGFVTFNSRNEYWSETRALEFLVPQPSRL